MFRKGVKNDLFVSLFSRPVLEPFMCEDTACPYEDARACDDPYCTSRIQARGEGGPNSYIPLRKDLVPYSWKRHCGAIAVLIGITIVAAICIVVATSKDENGQNSNII